MSYSQYMKHWKNHKKNKPQQCAPLVTSNPPRKKDFSVITKDGEFLITAYSQEHAEDLALEYGLTITERIKK